MKSTGQSGDTLTTGQQMHRQLIGIGFMAKLFELLAQPGTKQREQLYSLALRPVVELGKFATERTHRAAVTFNLGLIHKQNIDEFPNTISWSYTLDLPFIQHGLGIT